MAKLKRYNAGSRRQSTPVRTSGYKPYFHYMFQQPRDLPIFSFAIIRMMMMDPCIMKNLGRRRAPLAGMKFGYEENGEWIDGVKSRNPSVGRFVHRQLQHIWKCHLPAILRAQLWGWSAGEITLKLSQYNQVEIDKLEPRHASDCRMMTENNQPTGIRVGNIQGAGKVDLPFPYAWFHNHRAHDGEHYGKSICMGAFSPWADKWLNGGALDVRRLFMHKDAYGGVDIAYPDGDTWVDGQTEPIKNSDIARQIAEQLASGGVTTRPSARDENGNEKWPLTRATVPNNPQHILQYPKDLDMEIDAGMECPSSEEEEGGWAGKRVTMAGFYNGLNEWASELISDLTEQVMEPLVMLNYGRADDFEINFQSLAEQAMEQQSNAGPDTGSGLSAQAGGMSQQQPFMGNSPFSRMSLDPIQAVGEGVLNASELVKAASSVIRMAAVHAPVGGVTVQGKKFKGGEFIPGDVLASATPQEKAAIKGKGKLEVNVRNVLVHTPNTIEEAGAIATSARARVIGDSDDALATNGDCVPASMAIASLNPDWEIWSGEFLGEGVDREIGGHHVIAKCGDYFIDITHDQFGGSPMMVFTESGKEKFGYGAFRRSLGLEERIDTIHKGIAKDLDDYEGTERLLSSEAFIKLKHDK